MSFANFVMTNKIVIKKCSQWFGTFEQVYSFVTIFKEFTEFWTVNISLKCGAYATSLMSLFYDHENPPAVTRKGLIMELFAYPVTEGKDNYS